MTRPPSCPASTSPSTLLMRSRPATPHCSTSKDDTATIAYKQTLRKTIHEVRVGRNKNIVGKKDQAVVDTLNKEISKADKVRANAKSTVAQLRHYEYGVDVAMVRRARKPLGVVDPFPRWVADQRFGQSGVRWNVP
ncbi:hypothetical protein AV530_002146 [Patagioenas fasciata monilis]|uniref:Uncharacterized protein n=1 Tax=Patagioenas fasciata monilis TaxID=372326 RepID=A0A1V4KWX6_PATFA|nr:hypothetical protein AV530_002146 [Patagioenas fasciata monilis]